MGRKPKYSSPAEKQAAYRNRQRVTKCPRCDGSKCIAVTEEQARQFGVYCTVLCFECNGLITEDGRVWGFYAAPNADLPEWVVVRPSEASVEGLSSTL